MTNSPYEHQHVDGGVPVKLWTRGVPVNEKAREQLARAARLPFVFRHVAAMPDVHVGIGATVGSVIPTKGAVIPAAVGVDIGCGMMAARTSLMAHDLPDSLEGVRAAIEQAVPHGRSSGRSGRDKGAWDSPPPDVVGAWANVAARFSRIVEKYPRLGKTNNLVHLGTLGTGNHFIELCLDEEARVWIMLHSGSRGVGNAIGTFFIELAREDMRKWHVNLPDENLAYFPEGTDHFDDYVEAVGWAQDFAALIRKRWHKDMRTAGAVMEMLKIATKKWIWTDDPRDDEFVRSAWERLRELQVQQSRALQALHAVGVTGEIVLGIGAGVLARMEAKPHDRPDTRRLVELTQSRWKERAHLAKLGLPDEVSAAAMACLDELEELDRLVNQAQRAFEDKPEPYVEAEQSGRELYRDIRAFAERVAMHGNDVSTGRNDQ